MNKSVVLKLSNSSYGCLLCNTQLGPKRPLLRSFVYTGSRLLLYEHHALRCCGQKEFHAQVWDAAFPLRPEYTAEEMGRMYYQGDKLYSDILKAECKEVTLDTTRTTLPTDWAEFSEARFSKRRNAKDTVWYHSDPRFSFDKFKQEVRFPFPDHRHRVVYRSESTEDYITSGLIASGKREAEELLCAAGKKRPKKPKDFSYNGAHGVSPLIGELSSFEVANLCPDAMHYMLNQSNYLFKLYSRDRGLTDGGRQLAVSQGTVSELDDIIKRIYETRAVFEGLFPESEQVFICHQLVDIANHIGRFGHLRGLMCFASERANGFISQSVTKGGTRYLSTMYNRYVIKENSMLGKFARDTEDVSYNNNCVFSC